MADTPILPGRSARMTGCRVLLFRFGTGSLRGFTFQQKPLPQISGAFLPKILFLSFAIKPGFVAIPARHNYLLREINASSETTVQSVLHATGLSTLHSAFDGMRSSN